MAFYAQGACAAHVRDAIELVKHAWDSLSPSVIAANWDNFHCLPAIDTAEASCSIEETVCMEHNTIELCVVLNYQPALTNNK